MGNTGYGVEVDSGAANNTVELNLISGNAQSGRQYERPLCQHAERTC